MRIAAAGPRLVIAAVLLASCDRPPIDPSQSLVGARQLPSAHVLSRESIFIAQGLGGRTPVRLSYELRPDDRLIVALTTFELEGKQGEETFQLAPNLARQVRQSLWRLRPEILRGIEWETLPVGCPRPPIDSSPDFSVAFIAEGPKPGVADDRAEAVVIPTARACSSKPAVQARRLVQGVLHSFPSSTVAAEFDRRVREWEASLRS